MTTSLMERSTGSLVERKEDVLLACLVWLTQHHERATSADALRAGLPLVDNQLTPELFVRACERAGLVARTVKRPLAGFSNVALPAVLLLNDRHACILTRLIDDKTVEILLPETGFGVTRMPLAELAARYLGFGILTKPVYRAADRTADPLDGIATGSPLVPRHAAELLAGLGAGRRRRRADQRVCAGDAALRDERL